MPFPSTNEKIKRGSEIMQDTPDMPESETILPDWEKTIDIDQWGLRRRVSSAGEAPRVDITKDTGCSFKMY
jgi:hypothetical protein